MSRTFAPSSPKQEAFLNEVASEDGADIVLFGGAAGSGKSYLGVMAFLAWVTRQDMHMFRGVILRRTMVQVSGPGGPAETGQDIYQEFSAQWKSKEGKFVFPNKATIVCKGCEQEKDRFNFQGWQVSAFLVDEAQQFEESQILYFISRMRTEAPMRPRMIMTANPDYDSYLRVWLEDAGYLDDKGFPREDMDGKKTWFIRVGNDMIWAKTREALLEKYGEKCGPMSFTFFPATCVDNPILLERDPSYLFKLQSLPRVERERLLDGCWYSREEASTLFQRGWVTEVDLPPQTGVTRVRAYDLAGTLKSEANYDPDYSATVLMSRDKNGIFTIEEVERRRGRHGDIEDWILSNAYRDGPNVTVIIPKDAGAAGGAWCASIMRKLSESGYYSRSMPIAGKSKILRFAPFASAAHAGAIRIVRNCVSDTENNIYGKNDVLFDELESFDGSRKGHDDMADGCADAYTALAKSLVLPHFELPNMQQINPFKIQY